MNAVNNPESVADHSMRTAYLAMILCPPEVDQAKAVQMALVHDLAEALIGDISPHEGISRDDKIKRESSAWTQISGFLGSDVMEKLWLELESGVTQEAKFVFELDKLEMLIQAEEYEKLQPGIDLSSFFGKYPGFEGYDSFFTFPATQEIYAAILAWRAAAGNGQCLSL
jgi:putative hydrolase of HD superfamily